MDRSELPVTPRAHLRAHGTAGVCYHGTSLFRSGYVWIAIQKLKSFLRVDLAEGFEFDGALAGCRAACANNSDHEGDV